MIYDANPPYDYDSCVSSLRAPFPRVRRLYPNPSLRDTLSKKGVVLVSLFYFPLTKRFSHAKSNFMIITK